MTKVTVEISSDELETNGDTVTVEEAFKEILAQELNGEFDLSQASIGRFEYSKLDGVTARVHLD